MTRGIIRALWGKYDVSDRILRRKARVDGNIKELMKNKYNTPFITYCFGTHNYDMLLECGIPKDSIRMVSSEFHQYDLLKEHYMHKLHAIRLAHEEFDEVIQCDWDVLPTKAWSDEVWNILGKKESFQSNLYYYKKSKALWRKIDQRKLCNGGFTYTRGKEPINKIIEIWQRKPNKSCEPAMSKYIDELYGSWIGTEEYRRLHEPDVCELRRNSPYGKYPLGSPYFVHHAGLGSCSNSYLE